MARPAPAPPGPAAARAVTDLGPLEQLRAGRLPRRLVQLVVGLWLYGGSMALMVRGDVGVSPWDVLHTGLQRYLPLSLGQIVIAMSLVVLVAWWPLREKPGLGTIANAVLIGTSTDVTLAMVDAPSSMPVRIGFMVGGVLLNAVATAMYIGSHLGRGPRDGLMTGLVRRTGLSVRVVRTSLELTVVLVGFLLGGAVGAGTLLYAVALGPLVQPLLPRLAVRLPPPRPAEPVAAGPVSAGSRPAPTRPRRPSRRRW